MYASLSRAVLVVLLLASGVAGPAQAAPGAQQTSATLTIVSGQARLARGTTIIAGFFIRASIFVSPNEDR